MAVESVKAKEASKRQDKLREAKRSNYKKKQGKAKEGGVGLGLQQSMVCGDRGKWFEGCAERNGWDGMYCKSSFVHSTLIEMINCIDSSLLHVGR